MSTHGDEIAFLVNVETQIIRNLTISRYFGAAGLALLFYDTMITMEVEIRLVWPGPLKIPKVLYYINRYWSIASLVAANYLVAGFRPPLSNDFAVSHFLAAFTKQRNRCQIWVLVGAIAEMIAEVAAAAILVLRVVALYERNRWLVRGLWILYVLLHATTFIIAIFTIKTFYKNFVYDPLSGVCLPVNVSNKSYGMFAIPVAFDAIVFTLTMFKTYRLAAIVRKESGAMILYTMLRDGIMYFVTIVALRTFNTIVWAVLPNSFVYLGIYAYWALISSLTSRLFLNLRAASYDRPVYIRNPSTTAVSAGNRQTMFSQKMKLDTTLSATVLNVERGASTKFGQIFNRHGPEENRNGSEMELQPRSRHTVD